MSEGLEETGPLSANDLAMTRIRKPNEILAESDEIEIAENLSRAYIGSNYLKMRGKQTAKGQPFRALFTDIDHTFDRNKEKTSAVDAAEEINRQDYPIVAVTGNRHTAILNRIESGELPQFQIIAGSVGTDIWLLHENAEGEKNYIQDEAFNKLLLESGYIRQEITKRAKELVEQLSTTHPDWKLDFQRPDEERQYLEGATIDIEPFKVSYYFLAATEDLAEITQVISTTFPNQEIVICEEIGYTRDIWKPGDTIKKYCVDIVPITKAGCVDYISNLTKVKQKIVAGDSGNDLDMLINAKDAWGVLVGGAKDEARIAVDTITIGQQTKNFRTVSDKNGEPRKLYVESRENRIGRDSIEHAAKILLRAERIAQLRSGDQT